MLWASPPAAGADADGRFDVDSVLVTEFLLSFVGTLAGLKLSSDIAACSQRAQAFQSCLAKRGFERRYRSRAAPQRVVAARTDSWRYKQALDGPATPLSEEPIVWAASEIPVPFA